MLIHNLLRHKSRTAMCVIAVAISTALLVSLLSVAEGIWENASYSIITSKEDILITPQLPGGSGTSRGISNGHKIANDIRNDKLNISEVSPMFMGLLNILNDQGATENISETNVGDNLEPGTDNFESQLPSVVLSIGVIPERFEKFLLEDNTYGYGIIKFKFDDWFEIPGDPHYANDFSGPWTYEALVDDYLAQAYDLQPGSTIDLSIGIEPVTFKVSGIFDTNLKKEYFEDYFNVKGLVILHLSEYQSLVGEDIIKKGNDTIVVDNVNTIAISLNQEGVKQYSVDEITFGLQEKYPLLEMLTKEEQLESLEEQNAMTRVFYTAISIVSIIIGLLFVACIMLISVYERTNEIGMLRAIGISRSTIFKWVLLESILLIIIGILVGFLPGYFGAELLGDYISNDIGISEDLTTFSPTLIILSFFSMLALGTLISLIPAVQASVMKVTEAISFVR